MTAANDNDFGDFDAYDMEPEAFLRWFHQTYSVEYVPLADAVGDGGDPLEDYDLDGHRTPTRVTRADQKLLSHADVENIRRFVDIISGQDPEDPGRLSRFPDNVSLAILAEEGDEEATFVPELH
jgi:hypothetical protein